MNDDILKFFNEEGIFICLSNLLLVIMYTSMKPNFDGVSKEMFDNFSQSWKQLLPILVTEAGISIWGNDLQYSNVFTSNFVKEEGFSKPISDNDEQWENANPSICLIEDGNINLDKLEQYAKTYSPICLTDEGILIVWSDWQPNLCQIRWIFKYDFF